MDEKRKVEMDKSAILLGDACENCERIFAAPVPLVYTRHTARFLSAWLLLVPLALWEPFGTSWNHLTLAPAMTLLAPRPGEHVLDVGCGDGALTERLVEAGCVVLGVDSSPAQVAAARGRGLSAEVMDAAALDFDQRFDAVFSNATLHWVKDADAAIVGVHAALKPAGRRSCTGRAGGARTLGQRRGAGGA